MTSVCTGSLILGAAGLLRGYRATSHWCVRDAVLPLLGAEPGGGARGVRPQPGHGGRDLGGARSSAWRSPRACAVPITPAPSQLVAEYAPEPPFRAGTPAEAGPAIVRAAEAILAPLVAGATEAARR